jgi:ABC transporter substrate binding protein
MTSPFFYRDRARLADFALRHRMPSMFVFREWVEAGGLLSYGPSITGMYRRAADYVDRIARGAKPGDLPVELPTKLELVINLKTAMQIRDRALAESPGCQITEDARRYRGSRSAGFAAAKLVLLGHSRTNCVGVVRADLSIPKIYSVVQLNAEKVALCRKNGRLSSQLSDYQVTSWALPLSLLEHRHRRDAPSGLDVLQLWHELDGFGVIGERAVDLSRGLVGDAAVVVGPGELWVKLDCLGVIGDGAVVLSHGLVGDAAVVVGLGVLWVELDCLGIIGDGAVDLSLGPVGDAAVVVSLSVS